MVVGSEDRKNIRHVAEAGGDNHVERARFFVSEMKALAEKNGLKSKINLVIVDGVGHRFSKIAHALQNAILEYAK